MLFKSRTQVDPGRNQSTGCRARLNRNILAKQTATVIAKSRQPWQQLLLFIPHLSAAISSFFLLFLSFLSRATCTLIIQTGFAFHNKLNSCDNYTPLPRVCHSLLLWRVVVVVVFLLGSQTGLGYSQVIHSSLWLFALFQLLFQLHLGD